MLNSGWSKFNKYYQLTDDTHAYAAVLVFNPRRKWRWIEKKWPSWLLPVKRKVQKIWDTTYKPVGSQTNKTSFPRTTNDFWLDIDTDDKEDFSLFNEYTSYCSALPINTRNAIRWWLEKTQQKTYPNLSKMALDYLSIPSMSVEAKRLFSGCKIILSNQRNRMGAELLEALECLKSWLKIKDREAEVLEGLISTDYIDETVE